jgi:hypothetical protein
VTPRMPCGNFVARRYRPACAPRFSPSSPGLSAPPPENGEGPPLPAELYPVAERLLKRGFHELAHEAHPDHDGSDAAMRLVVAAYELLCARFKVAR